MSRISKYSAIIIDILLLLAVSLLPLLWISPGQFVTGNDAAYPINILDTYARRFFAWTEIDSFGQDTSMHFGSLFIHSILAFGKYIGLTNTDGQRLTFVFWFFVILISMYLFASSLKKRFDYRYFPLLAALFYGINFFLLELWKLGAATTFSVYAALPLLMMFILPVFEGRGSILHASLSIALISVFLNGGLGFSTPLFGGVIITVLTGFIYYFIFSLRTDPFNYLRRVFMLLIFSSFLVVMVNAYAFIPFINYIVSNYSSQVSSHGGVEGIISWTREVSKSTSISNLFRFLGYPDWYETGIGPDYARDILKNPLFIVVSMFLAPLAYASLFIQAELRKRKFVVYLVILSLAAILFSAGTHEPTGWLFIQFIKYVPGFAIFRSAQYKFVPALFFSMSLLLSFVINFLYVKYYESKKNNSRWSLMGRTVFPVFIITGILFYHYPYFGKSNFIWRAPMTTLVEIPKYIFDYDKAIAHLTSQNMRILVAPRLNTTWGSEAYDWGYMSVSSLFNLLKPAPFVSNSYLLNDALKVLVDRTYTEILDNGEMVIDLVQLLNISHVISRNDVIYTLDWIPSESPRIFEDAIGKSDKYAKVWDSSKWKIYKVNGVKDGKFSSINTLVKISGHENGVIGPLLLGASNFYYHRPDAPVPPSGVEAMIGKSEIVSLSCNTCALDDSVGGAERAYSRILPGSILYPLKLRRENANLSKLQGEQLFMFHLGYSLNHVTEIEQLIGAKESEVVLAQSIGQLEKDWNFINTYIAANNISSNMGIIRALESYGVSERGMLTGFLHMVKDRDLSSRLNAVLNNINVTLDSVYEYRVRSFTYKTFLYRGNIVNGDLYIDGDSLPKDTDNEAILPAGLYVDGQRKEFIPKVTGDRIYLGRHNFQNVRTVELEFTRQENLLTRSTAREQMFDGEARYCLQFPVSNYHWKKNYRMTVSNPLLMSASDLILVAQSQQSYSDSVGERILLDVDKKFSIAAEDDKKQFIYFYGKEGGVSARIYYCTQEYARLALNTDNFFLEEVFRPSVYVANAEGQYNRNVQSTVNYVPKNPTDYHVALDDSPQERILIFNENYNPNWKLYPRSITEGSVLNKFFFALFHKPLYEKNHFVINGYANAWLLPTDAEKNLVVFFYPQHLFTIGIIVSLITLSFILIVKMWLYRK